MFNRIGLCSAFLLTLIGTVIYQFQIKPQPQDFEALSSIRAMPPAPQKKEAVQERTGVKKEIWTVKNGQRTLFQLKSQTSTLTIEPASHKVGIVEKLHNLNCCMQEEITLVNGAKVQEIRTLAAEEGTYFFPAHQFITDEVDLKFFRLLGDVLPASNSLTVPYLSGQARDVIFGANEKSLQFNAHYLKANLDPKQVFQEGL